MLNYDYCLWDFNGTILDDVELGINAVNKLLAERGIPTIPNKDAYRAAFDFPIIEYYKKLGFDFTQESYEVVAKLWVNNYLAGLGEASLFDGVLEALDFFDSHGVHQSVLSASERGMLSGQLKDLGIYGRFEEVLGIDNIYADSKLAIAKHWREEHPDAHVMFIGDTTHDCETAELLGADCYIVTAGHHPREKFEGMSSIRLFSTLYEVIDYLKNKNTITAEEK